MFSGGRRWEIKSPQIGPNQAPPDSIISGPRRQGEEQVGEPWPWMRRREHLRRGTGLAQARASTRATRRTRCALSAAQPLEHHLLMVADDERLGGLCGMVYLVWKLTMPTPEAAAWKTCARPRRHHRMMRSAGTSGVRSAERERVVTGQEIIGRQEIIGTSRISARVYLYYRSVYGAMTIEHRRRRVIHIEP